MQTGRGKNKNPAIFETKRLSESEKTEGPQLNPGSLKVPHATSKVKKRGNHRRDRQNGGYLHRNEGLE